MPSILDFFNGTATPEQNAGLLGFATQMLNASNGRQPVNFGQALAAGANGYQQGRDDYAARQREKLILAHQAKLLGLKVQDAESDVANQAAARERAQKLVDFNKQYFGGAVTEGQAPASQMGGGAFTAAAEQYGLPTDVTTLNKIVDGVNSGMSPQEAAAAIGGQPKLGAASLPQLGAPQQKGLGQKQSIFDQRMAYAQALRSQGFAEQADAQEAQALKFQPKVKDWKQVQVNGQILFAPFFEDGTPGTPVPYEAAVELQRANTGGTTDLYNPMTGQTVRSITNTAGPDALLAAQTARRGQDMVDARAAASNPSSKPLPTAALKMQQNELEALSTASGINADLKRIEGQIDGGKLTFGPVSNLVNRGLNAAGMSTEESRNFASFQSTLEKLRNDSLRLNAGVQTDGDAQRAWNELFANINDKGVVKQRLNEIRNINSRAVQLRKMNIDGIRANYGHEALDTTRYESPTQAAPQASSATTPRAPMKGQVVRGYRFKGGDPADPNSWERK